MVTFFAIGSDELMAIITLSLENASTLSQHTGEAIFYCSSLKKKKAIRGLRTLTEPNYMKLIIGVINYDLHE